MIQEPDFDNIFSLWDQLRKKVCGQGANGVEFNANDCESIQRYSYHLLSASQNEDLLRQVQEQIDACSTYCEIYSFERRWRQLLEAKCGAEKAPVRLRERVVTYIRSCTVVGEQGQTTAYIQAQWSETQRAEPGENLS